MITLSPRISTYLLCSIILLINACTKTEFSPSKQDENQKLPPDKSFFVSKKEAIELISKDLKLKDDQNARTSQSKKQLLKQSNT